MKSSIGKYVKLKQDNLLYPKEQRVNIIGYLRIFRKQEEYYLILFLIL